jgi:hypothetical protein
MGNNIIIKNIDYITVAKLAQSTIGELNGNNIVTMKYTVQLAAMIGLPSGTS